MNGKNTRFIHGKGLKNEWPYFFPYIHGLSEANTWGLGCTHSWCVCVCVKMRQPHPHPNLPSALQCCKELQFIDKHIRRPAHMSCNFIWFRWQMAIIISILLDALAISGLLRISEYFLLSGLFECTCSNTQMVSLLAAFGVCSWFLQQQHPMFSQNTYCHSHLSNI